ENLARPRHRVGHPDQVKVFGAAEGIESNLPHDGLLDNGAILSGKNNGVLCSVKWKRRIAAPADSGDTRIPAPAGVGGRRRPAGTTGRSSTPPGRCSRC